GTASSSAGITTKTLRTKACDLLRVHIANQIIRSSPFVAALQYISFVFEHPYAWSFRLSDSKRPSLSLFSVMWNTSVSPDDGFIVTWPCWLLIWKENTFPSSFGLTNCISCFPRIFAGAWSSLRSKMKNTAVPLSPPFFSLLTFNITQGKPRLSPCHL